MGNSVNFKSQTEPHWAPVEHKHLLLSNFKLFQKIVHDLEQTASEDPHQAFIDMIVNVNSAFEIAEYLVDTEMIRTDVGEPSVGRYRSIKMASDCNFYFNFNLHCIFKIQQETLILSLFSVSNFFISNL